MNEKTKRSFSSENLGSFPADEYRDKPLATKEREQKLLDIFKVGCDECKKLETAMTDLAYGPRTDDVAGKYGQLKSTVEDKKREIWEKLEKGGARIFDLLPFKSIIVLPTGDGIIRKQRNEYSDNGYEFTLFEPGTNLIASHLYHLESKLEQEIRDLTKQKDKLRGIIEEVYEMTRE